MIPAILNALRKNWHWQSLILRRALRASLIAAISVLIYEYLSIRQGYWITLTAMLVVQATLGATLRKAIQRFIGTLLGVSVASSVLLLMPHHHVIDALVLIFLFITYFFSPFNNLINYGLVVIPISILVVFMMALISPEKMDVHIIYARFYDTIMGAFLGIMGAFLLFPNRVKQEFSTNKLYLRKQLGEYFFALINMLLNIPGATQQARSKKMLVEEALLANYQFYRENRYETHWPFTTKTHHTNALFLQTTEAIAQQAFSLQHLVYYPLASELLSLISPLFIQLRNHLFAAFNGQSIYLTMIADDLVQLQEKMMDYTQKKEGQNMDWRYLAPLANLQLILHTTLTQLHLLTKTDT